MNNVKTLIERFSEKQKEGFFPCPRCGKFTMDDKPVRNALSRRADVYVCNSCGMSEAFEDFAGKPMEIENWAIVQYPKCFRMEAEE